MKSEGLGKWWNGLTSNQKFFLVVFILLLLWLAYRQFKGAIEGVGINVQSGGTLASLSAKGIKPSYQSSDYKRFSDRLIVAMDGAGTDEDIIYNIYNYMHNDADMVRLNQAFGVRQQSTLNEWLKGDLSSEAIGRINDLLRERGISKTIK